MRRGLARAAQSAFVLWLTVTLNFLLPHLAPGHPIDYFSADGGLDAGGRAVLAKQYGVDGSLATQYGRYLGNLARGDLGTSVRFHEPVADVLVDRLPWTLLLVGTGLLASSIVGTLAGAAAAWRRGRRIEVGLVAGVLITQAVPPFWLGMVLVAVFALTLGWLPSFGAISPGGGLAGVAALADVARHLVLPAITITVGTLGAYFLLVRSAMLSTLETPYVVMARAKGAPPRSVVYRHALRNALLPAYTHLAVSVGALLSGAVVVETVFGYPGLGRVTYEAIAHRDYPLLSGAFLLITVAVVVTSLVADLTYPLLDPRVRRGPAGRTGPTSP